MVTSFRLSKAIRIQIAINKFQNIHKSRLDKWLYKFKIYLSKTIFPKIPRLKHFLTFLSQFWKLQMLHCEN